ncbi:nuclear transport factor 2 family protein [Paenibacillus sp. IB182496]|uniref:Nuclear transport factor 2 family protein n=1 Tax=Paenibacillus sabuli TaxID=2772509 RepID=A0A927BUF6_9BACL|nr:nuclear transport factor 2 family protein [Paenibacillus sabuli]MBD2847032.1 nuclear transport factor 2 family protein [Paenibacillus sabuli]
MANQPAPSELIVTCPAGCDNAPRKAVLKAFNVAFASGDAEALVEQVADDIVWQVVGEGTVAGRAGFAERVNEMAYVRAVELHLHTIITHGPTASANGLLVFPDGTRYAFCDVYQFTSAAKQGKIKRIDSYVIGLAAEDREDK